MISRLARKTLGRRTASAVNYEKGAQIVVPKNIFASGYDTSAYEENKAAYEAAGHAPLVHTPPAESYAHRTVFRFLIGPFHKSDLTHLMAQWVDMEAGKSHTERMSVRDHPTRGLFETTDLSDRTQRVKQA